MEDRESIMGEVWPPEAGLHDVFGKHACYRCEGLRICTSWLGMSGILIMVTVRIT